MLSQLRQDLGSPLSALTVLLEGKRGLHDGADLFGKKSDLFVEAFEILTMGTSQLRFIVPSIDLALTTVHDQPNNRLGPGGKMWNMRSPGHCAG